ncbi:hypothetical protein WDW37_04985 [Bdellovibrionota bacterium FG-1]
MRKFTRTSVALFGIGFITAILGSGAQADDVTIRVDQFSETAQALSFHPADHPETTYYIPKTHEEVKCEKPLSNRSNFWTCTILLVREGLAPAELGPNTQFYPFTPSSECALKRNSADSRPISSLKSNAALKLRVQGMTPAGDSGVVCSFGLAVRGEAAQVESLIQTLSQQAEAHELIESPIKVKLTELTPVGVPLQTYLANDLGLSTIQSLSRGEASFLLGLAAGRIAEVSERLSQLNSADRAGFYRRALNGLFNEISGGLMLKSQPISRLGVTFEKSYEFIL